MSLKAFHVAFIVLSTLLCVVLLAWGWNDYSSSGGSLGLGLAATGGLGLLLLIPYYNWFRKKARSLGILALLLPLVSGLWCSLPYGTAQACSVCFGDPSSPVTKGLKVGILFLLAVIGGVLVAIASIAYTWSRRAKALPHP